MSTTQDRGRPRRPLNSNDRNSTEHVYELANSIVTIEFGPVGPLARIDRADRTDYAGPLAEETIDAIAEVADG